MIPEGGNNLVCVAVPRERVLLPGFVDSRDTVIETLKKAGQDGGKKSTSGCRIEINRNELVYWFLNDPRQAEWLLFLDNDMVFPSELGVQLSKWRKPVVGGLYFQSGPPHDPIVFDQGQLRDNKWGVPTQYYNPLRDQVFDFLEMNRVPFIPYPMILTNPTGDPLLSCGGVGTGALMIHRSVLEQMRPPWFIYKGDEGEDLLFCQRVREELGLPVYVDMSTMCGHLTLETKTQADFRQTFLERGLFLSGYDHTIAVRWLSAFFGLTPEQADEQLSSYHPSQMGALWADAETLTPEQVLDFYKDPRVGRLYVTELLNWNQSQMFRSMRRQLINVRDKRVLEIGGGIGTVSIQLMLQRNKVHMVEPNKILRDFARFVLTWQLNRLAGGTQCGGLQFFRKLPTSTKYDYVVALDVFEHIHPSELPGMLIEIGKLVPEGGWLLHHNNWGQQDLFPFHYDHSGSWDAWLRAAGFFPANPPFWSLKIRNN